MKGITSYASGSKDIGSRKFKSMTQFLCLQNIKTHLNIRISLRGVQKKYNNGCLKNSEP